MLKTRPLYYVTLYTYVSDDTNALVKFSQKKTPMFTVATKNKKVKVLPVEIADAEDMDFMYYMNIHDICSAKIQLADIKLELSMN